MLIDALPTLSNTIMHHKHFSRLMAKSMNELAHKSPLIVRTFRLETEHVQFKCFVLPLEPNHAQNVFGCFDIPSHGEDWRWGKLPCGKIGKMVSFKI